jgi:hypothetical protein
MFAAVCTLSLIASAACAQGGMDDKSKAVEGGGVKVAGWMGKIDAREASGGATIANAKLTMEDKALHVVTGPASAFWDPKNTASGDYTVKATFNEPKYMNLNSHPHPYGVFIGGNDMGTDNQSYLYCAAYGSGNFIVRGFGPASFMMNGGRGEMNAAVNKAEAPGKPVMQEIAMSVKGDEVSCAINGKTVATYKKADVVGAGKLKSTDGVYGIRSSHNTEVFVTGLSKK